jgi:hypothetical protein
MVWRKNIISFAKFSAINKEGVNVLYQGGGSHTICSGALPM